MSLTNADYYKLSYWQMVYDKLQTDFVDISLSLEPKLQIGIWVIERADMVLKPKNLVEFFKEDALFCKKLIIDIILLVVDKYPKFFFTHFYLTLGAFPYSGLLNMFDTNIQKMWKDISDKHRYSSSESKRAISDLSDILLSDKELCSKLEVLIHYNEDGRFDDLSIEQCIYELEKLFTLDGYDDPSIEILFKLGILKEYRKPNLDDDVVEAGRLFKKLHILKESIDSKSVICKFFKNLLQKYRYSRCHRKWIRVLDLIQHRDTM